MLHRNDMVMVMVLVAVAPRTPTPIPLPHRGMIALRVAPAFEPVPGRVVVVVGAVVRVSSLEPPGQYPSDLGEYDIVLVVHPPGHISAALPEHRRICLLIVQSVTAHPWGCDGR